ncbi:ABC transporter ATP-binding protein [Pelagibius litoralis]|uniref:ABC transporter ATP-binding protein n=1 Tax=Pelagibius litoralis TaxID=374515 RepID=A0A967K802_9PROT|nr:ABC transporter ATP-binding protein [Pelagibius litoralis]NIA70153.1 ABC transporter ATP-binding protein [Pelagibius litoralis]
MYAFFERLFNPLTPAAIERPPTMTRAFFIHFLAPIKGLLLITLAVSAVAAVAEIALYAFLGKLVDWLTVGSPETFLREHAWALAGMAFVAVVLRPIAVLASRGLINLSLIPGLTNRVRWLNHRYVLRQSLSYFNNDFAGRIAQKVLQTGHALREAVVNVIDGVWFLLIYLVGTLVLFAGIDWRLLLPVLAWVLSYAAVIYFMVPPVRRKSATLSETNSALTGRIVDSYTNIQSVKLFADTEREDSFVGEVVGRHTAALRHLMRSVIGMTVVLTLLNTALIVLVSGLSIALWMSSSISTGAIAISISLIIRLTQMSGWILRTVTNLFENIGTVQNGIETISQPYAVQDHPAARTLSVGAGEVRFEGIRFHYGKAEGVIEELSLTVKPGEKVGIVGRSGAGKSTLVNLLLRFYDLESGRILIDGQDIAEVSQHSLRAQIAMVTQDTALLHRSIRDNILYGRPEAGETAMREAAEMAEAAAFIPELEDFQGRQGFDAHVGERGVKLSGGQRQRIAIARVILKDAPILVLDEATSALDSEVEAAIQGQLKNLMTGKTVIAIAHRLSTIAALDRLVVMDKGHIVEQGNHAELLRLGGLYARLWERQSGGFLGIDEGRKAS